MSDLKFLTLLALNLLKEAIPTLVVLAIFAVVLMVM